MTRLLLPLVVLAVAGSLPSAASAKSADDRKIEALAKEAQALYQQGELRRSAETLLRAYEIKPVPNLLFNVARTYDKAGDEEQAIRYYQRYIDVGAEAALVRRASQAADRLRGVRNARLAEEEKKRQEELEQAEGARREAEATRQAAVEAEARGRAERELARQRMEADAVAHARLQERKGPSPLFWMAGGTSVVAAGTGLFFGLRANRLRGEFDGSQEPARKKALMDSTRTSALVADVSYGVAGVAALGAVILFIATGGDDGTPAPAVTVGPAGTGASLAWGF